MNRRSFFKSVFAGIFGISICEGCGWEPIKEKTHCWVGYTEGSTDATWTFYINGEEIDSSKAVDNYGVLHWPFKGSRTGDICTAEGPKIYMTVRNDA